VRNLELPVNGYVFLTHRFGEISPLLSRLSQNSRTIRNHATFGTGWGGPDVTTSGSRSDKRSCGQRT
jgi:hypothetical protein